MGTNCCAHFIQIESKMCYMKNLLLIIFVLFILQEIFSQKFYPAPDFSFSGVTPTWIYRAKENCTDIDSEYWLPIACGDRMTQEMKHIVYKDKVFLLYNNAEKYTYGGSTLIGLNYYTGDSVWQNEYKSNLVHIKIPEAVEDEFGYNYSQSFFIFGQELELLGTLDYSKHYNLKQRIYYGGLSVRRVNPENGKTTYHKYNYYIMDRIITTIIEEKPLAINRIKDGFFLYQYNGIQPNTPDGTGELRPRILNDTFAGPVLQNNWIKFGPTKIHKIYHPVIVPNDSIFIYNISIPSFNGIREFRHYMWKVNHRGEYKDFQDVSEKFGGPELKFWIDNIEHIDTFIRLTITAPYKNLDTIFGHQGYLYITYDGKIIRDQRKLKLDGKPVGNIISTKLKGSKDQLHIVRFIDETDIYFYKEVYQGEFFKLGVMSIISPTIYTLIPKFVVQGEDGDLIITLDARLINIPEANDLRIGGWPFVCKINGRNLGIPTALNNPAKENEIFSFLPNPTTDHIEILASESGSFQIINIEGKILIQADLLSNKKEKIDVSELSSGIYFIKFMTRNREVKINKMIKK